MVDFLNEQQASDYLIEKGLPVATKTLGKYRVIGGGPKFRKFGRLPVYEPRHLDEWVSEKLTPARRSTSDPGGGGGQANGSGQLEAGT
jgi:hypothetical protein